MISRLIITAIWSALIIFLTFKIASCDFLGKSLASTIQHQIDVRNKDE